MRTRLRSLVLAALLKSAPLAVGLGQRPGTRPAPADSSRDAPQLLDTLPFAQGEKLDYVVSYGPVHLGHGSMELGACDTIRGRSLYHAIFRIRGGTFLFRVDDRIESWFDATEFVSMRFTQQIHEGRYHANRDFQIFPDEGTYRPFEDTARAAVARPLDDASFLYFVRTLQLRVGAQYGFDRYFQPEGNPIMLRVLREERVTVPAGTFEAIVIQPTFATQGIFGKDGHAEVWIRSDGAHEVLQMKSHLAFGSLSLALLRSGPPDARARTSRRSSAERSMACH